MALNICYQRHLQSLVGKYVYATTVEEDYILEANTLYKIVGTDSTTGIDCTGVHIFIPKQPTPIYSLIGAPSSHLPEGVSWKIATRDTVRTAKARGTFPKLAR